MGTDVNGTAHNYTGAPTPPPAVAQTIQQVLTVGFVGNAAGYAANALAKTLYEKTYAKTLTMCTDAACPAYKAGCSVTSEASDTAFSRRQNVTTVYIRMTAVASAEVSTAAAAGAAALVSTPATFASMMT